MLDVALALLLLGRASLLKAPFLGELGVNMSGQGAEAALQAITTTLGMQLVSKLPAFWAMVTGPLLGPSTSKAAPAQLAAASLTDSLKLLRIVGACLHPVLLPQLLGLLPSCWQACCSTDESQQVAAVECMASQAAAWTVQVVPLILRCATLWLMHNGPRHVMAQLLWCQ